MEELLTKVIGDNEYTDHIVDIFQNSHEGALQFISSLLNYLPFVAIGAIAVLVFNAIWSWKLFKPVMAVLGAYFVGCVGNIFSFLICQSLGGSTLINVISIPGVVTAISAIIGAILFFFAARLALSLGLGFSAYAVLSYYIEGNFGQILGIAVGLIAFILVLIFFKQVYLTITNILGLTSAGVIAGLAFTSGAEFSYIPVVAAVLLGLLGLFFGIKMFKKNFNGDC